MTGVQTCALPISLGFLFGLARGLVIVVVAFLFFAWLVPDRSQPDWVRNAKSKIVLQGTGEWLKAQLPDDPESTILKRLKKPRPDEQEPQDTAPGTDRSGMNMRQSGSRYAGEGSPPRQQGQRFVNADVPEGR